MKNRCSAGYDGVTAIPLKRLNYVTTKPLALIFNISMASGAIPSAWKKSIITPIFKKGDKSCANNYRPISLTSIVGKLMESIIKDSLLSYFSKNDLLYPKQYGFLPKKSTNAQLLRYFNEISSCLLDGCQVDAVYLDFSKAFDSIVHSKLVFKLQKYGISDSLLEWISCFLTDRIQTVKVNNSFSEWSPVVSGVPQGSVLGPLLFLIYINDLSTSCPDLKLLFLFADDAKCFACIRSLNDCIILQSSLDSVSNWSNLWQLNLASDKCQTLSFTYHTASFLFNYSVNSIPLVRVGDVLDLGVRFSQELSFSTHIKDMCNKGRRKASIILNCFKTKNRAILFRAFSTFVRPILDYCSNLWCPYKKSEIDLIESVQKRFTKRLNGMAGYNILTDLGFWKRNLLNSVG